MPNVTKKKLSKSQQVAAVKLSEMSAAVSPFLHKNPASTVKQAGTRTKFHYVAKPWNDRSIVFIMPDDPTSLIDALNNVILPTRLSAIYHTDTNDIEIIFTAQKLAESLIEIQDRTFSFRLHGNEYVCEFSESSERLLGQLYT